MSKQGKAEQVGTDEGNRIIAEFEGWESNKYPNLPNKMHRMEESQEVGVYLRHLPYHSDWSLLMPVVEKIKDMGYVTHIVIGKHSTCLINSLTDGLVGKGSSEGLIEVVYEAVVQFIKWHNQQSLTP